MTEEITEEDKITYTCREYIKYSKVNVTDFNGLNRRFGGLIGKVVKDIARENRRIDLFMEDGEEISFIGYRPDALPEPISGKSINSLINAKIIGIFNIYQESPDKETNSTTLEIVTERGSCAERGSCFIGFTGTGRDGIAICNKMGEIIREEELDDKCVRFRQIK